MFDYIAAFYTSPDLPDGDLVAQIRPVKRAEVDQPQTVDFSKIKMVQLELTLIDEADLARQVTPTGLAETPHKWTIDIVQLNTVHVLSLPASLYQSAGSNPCRGTLKFVPHEGTPTEITAYFGFAGDVEQWSPPPPAEVTIPPDTIGDVRNVEPEPEPPPRPIPPPMVEEDVTKETEVSKQDEGIGSGSEIGSEGKALAGRVPEKPASRARWHWLIAACVIGLLILAAGMAYVVFPQVLQQMGGNKTALGPIRWVIEDRVAELELTNQRLGIDGNCETPNLSVTPVFGDLQVSGRQLRYRRRSSDVAATSDLAILNIVCDGARRAARVEITLRAEAPRTADDIVLRIERDTVVFIQPTQLAEVERGQGWRWKSAEAAPDSNVSVGVQPNGKGLSVVLSGTNDGKIRYELVAGNGQLRRGELLLRGR